jgi:hypothetical protein
MGLQASWHYPATSPDVSDERQVSPDERQPGPGQPSSLGEADVDPIQAAT